MAVLREKAGLPRDVKNHGGRHTFATNAILNGVDLATLAELMGHTSAATTEKYIHLIDKKEHLNRAADRAIGQGKKPADEQSKNGQSNEGKDGPSDI